METTPFEVAPAHSSSFFLSFEGLEGAGKTTQAQKIQDYLISLGKEVSVFREPGGTAFGEALRDSILHRKSPLAPIAEAYLFASSRAQLLDEEILPRLSSPNQVVMVDRYYDSSIAYQGFGRELGPKTIALIHRFSPLHYMPHLTFYLDISCELSFSRMEEEGKVRDYFESQNILFFQRISSGFNWCVEHYSHRVKRIQGNRPLDAVTGDIIELLKKKFNE